MMSCKHVQNDLAAFLTGNLADTKKPDLEAHLKTCPVCQKQYQSMAAMWSNLGQLPVEKPDASMTARFDAMLNRYKESEPVRPQTELSGVSFRRWFEKRWSLQEGRQFGLAAALLVVGFLLGRTFGPDAAEGEMAALRHQVEELNLRVAVSLLEKSSPSDRLMGVSYSSRLERPDDAIVAALLYTLSNDQNVNVRLATVDALASMSDLPAVKEGLAAALVEQASPIIQIALIDVLVLTRNKRSVEALQKLQRIERLEPAVGERLQWAVHELN